jgi:hypothetical protein
LLKKKATKRVAECVNKTYKCKLRVNKCRYTCITYKCTYEAFVRIHNIQKSVAAIDVKAYINKQQLVNINKYIIHESSYILHINAVIRHVCVYITCINLARHFTFCIELQY